MTRKIKRTFVKTAKTTDPASFSEYPTCIKELFDKRYLSYISTVEMTGQERYSRSQKKNITEWSLVEAFAPNAHGQRALVLSVGSLTGKPVFVDLDTALRTFISKVDEVGCRCNFDRTDANTYNAEPAAREFFNSQDTQEIRRVRVFYQKRQEGYIAYAYKSDNQLEALVQRKTDGTPFSTPQEATRGLLQHFRQRDEGFFEH